MSISAERDLTVSCSPRYAGPRHELAARVYGTDAPETLFKNAHEGRADDPRLPCPLPETSPH